MAYKLRDSANVIEYVDDYGGRTGVKHDPAYSAIPGQITVITGQYGRSAEVSMKQARVIAERILQWCDEAEKKQ